MLKVHAVPSERGKSLTLRPSERSGSQNSVSARDSHMIRRLNRKAKLPALNSTTIGLNPAASPKKSLGLSDGRTLAL